MLTAILIGVIVALSITPFLLRLIFRRNKDATWGCCPGGIIGLILIILILILLLYRQND